MLLPCARRVDACMMHMGGKEILDYVEPPHGADLRPLKYPSAMGRKAHGMLQEAKETDKAVPTVGLILRTQSDLGVGGRLILDGWEHSWAREPDDKAAF